jgi:cation diffusion facilitator family transporter
MIDQKARKVKTARLSIFSNVFLIVIKLVAGILSGSVSIISEAIHSGMDLVAAIIAFFSVRVSSNPPDSRHPYGHGKFENVSGVVEAMLILVAAGAIIYESIKKIRHPEPVDTLGIGIAVMAASGIVNFFVSRQLYKVGRETESVALEADALHLKTDVYTSLGVAGGLALIWITGLQWLDPIVAIAVALLITWESYSLLKKAFLPLLDTTLPPEEMKIISESIEKVIDPKMSYHQLRARRSGQYKYVDLHLDVPANFSVAASHKICDQIETEIGRHFSGVEVNIHIEPITEIPEIKAEK